MIKCKNCRKTFKPILKKAKYCPCCINKGTRNLKGNSTRTRMIRNRDFVNNYKKDKRCEICGYNKYPEILVFHHKLGVVKYNGINILMKTLKNLETIQEEMSKCILLCPNCHREIHLKERIEEHDK
jgi:hypothetical protein